MKSLALLSLVLGVALAAPIAIAPRGGVVVPNEFIITTNGAANSMSMSQLEVAIDRIVAETEGKVLHRYANTIKGFAIRTNTAGVSMLRALNGVQIEANLVVNALECEDQTGSTWGLVRSSEHNLKIDGHYFYESLAGEGVDAYIVDTGIYIENDDFEGRASWGTDTVDNPSPKTDGNGHGTHVAGTVIGKTYGLAKKATAIAVKVLGASGSGTIAGVVAGVDWVAEHAATKKNGKASVANMSLGGGYSAALNAAVDAAVDAGVAFAVAAGNENQNACNVSPASAKNAFTVGATDKTDARSYFSNWGTCVKIFAPGSDITSAWIGSKTATKAISGTSMASPHVCGMLARFRAAHPDSSVAEAQQFLVDTASENMITDVKTGSPNKLLYGACEF
jgi:subtilisin family serine protease